MRIETEIADKSAKRVFIKSYGCQMNAYDAERMADLLRPLGYVQAGAPESADLVILNTCHIREKASEKVYSDLGRLRELKEARAAAGAGLTIAVAGCVAQAEGREIATRAPAVDLVVGPQAYHRLPELLARAAREKGEVLDTDFAAEEKFDRLAVREARGPTAFVTVQEGCDKFCTFCVVPYTRGAEISRSADAVRREAEMLVGKGVREITLLGQNVNAWRAAAADASVRARADGSWGLAELCRFLARIDGLERIRFMTSHPRDMDEALIETFAELEQLMPYLHLPVQSGSDGILAAMNRGHTVREYRAAIAHLRRLRPHIALSSDFIVGFPGETTEDFEATMSLVAEIEFASAYSFKYSRRPGTPAAAMPKQVAESLKEERLARLNAVLDAQRRRFNERQVGRTLPVLFEKRGRHEGQLVGRSPYLQSVHAEAPDSLLGTIVPVHVIGTSPNALSGAL
jgi:tRNA-2-methylthio-N6-dimethylallyladenosine synthase